MVARALEPLECKIHSAQNGNEGLSLAKKLKPDIIITDVMMPDMNGYELTRTLRREPEFAATPILVLTAQSGLEAKIQSFEAGADDHLTKPFEAAELAARVTALLRRLEAAKAPRPEAAPRRIGLYDRGPQSARRDRLFFPGRLTWAWAWLVSGASPPSYSI